jgi:NCS1 family nucleobase:cation symporter-1
MVPFMNTGILEGPAATALAGADISFYVGFIVAAAVYVPLRNLETGRGHRVPSRLAAAGTGS